MAEAGGKSATEFHALVLYGLQPELLNCNELTLKLYKIIVDQSYFVYDTIKIGSLDAAKVKYLALSAGIIMFNEISVEALMDNHPQLVVKFILPRADDFLAFDTPPLLRESHYLEIIESEILTLKSKLSFLNLSIQNTFRT